jgi:hypothetical protein
MYKSWAFSVFAHLVLKLGVLLPSIKHVLYELFVCLVCVVLCFYLFVFVSCYVMCT